VKSGSVFPLVTLVVVAVVVVGKTPSNFSLNCLVFIAELKPEKDSCLGSSRG